MRQAGYLAAAGLYALGRVVVEKFDEETLSL
jgi:hypothetical protein